MFVNDKLNVGVDVSFGELMGVGNGVRVSFGNINLGYLKIKMLFSFLFEVDIFDGNYCD